MSLRSFIDVRLLGKHRLKHIRPLPLGSSLSEAISLYGEPFESEADKEVSEVTVHTFAAGKYHEVVVTEWQNRIQSITYWSAKGDPPRDLAWMLENYKDDSQWALVEEGYLYQREDGKLRLWCSAVPTLGVAYIDFFIANGQLKQANARRKLYETKYLGWAPENVIEELQRDLVTGKSSDLLEFAGHSKRTLISSDGRHVLIVQDHHANHDFDVEDDFIVLNCRPEADGGYASQVIRFVTWSNDQSTFHDGVLPKDANVESMRFEGDICHLDIRWTTTGQLISLSRPASAVDSLPFGWLVQ